MVSPMPAVSSAQALDLWVRFSMGGVPAIESDPWVQGPRVRSPEEIAAIHERSRQITLESDRQFFESLGPEDRSRRCKRDGCAGGMVKYSVLCAAHHFEQVRGKPYPLLPQAHGGDA